MGRRLNDTGIAFCASIALVLISPAAHAMRSDHNATAVAASISAAESMILDDSASLQNASGATVLRHRKPAESHPAGRREKPVTQQDSAAQPASEPETYGMLLAALALMGVVAHCRQRSHDNFATPLH